MRVIAYHKSKYSNFALNGATNIHVSFRICNRTLKIKKHSGIDKWLLRHKDIRVSGEFKELHFQGCGIISHSLFTDSPCLLSSLEQK
jgi:hypothetical protein